MASDKKSWRGRGFSLVRYYVKHYGSPVIAAAILVLIASNLSATARMRVLLQDILSSGVVQSGAQEAYAEWDTDTGISCRIVTPRNPRESDAAHAKRHADAVRAFSEDFPPTTR